MKHLITILIASLLSIQAFSQEPISSPDLSADGLMDSVYDSKGSRHRLNDLRIDNPNSTFAVTNTCDAGYFRLYFKPTITATQQAILCQVFTDIACFISSPLYTSCHPASNSVTKVNVYVDDQAGGALGTAGPFYLIPANPSNPNPGIVENVVWKTIVSGSDPYAGIVVPLVQQNNFYHMVVNVNTSYPSWNYNVASTSMPTNQQDFYTIFLHEITHGLGFASLFSPNGNSIWWPSANYYSRYDLFLRDKNFTPLLTNLAPAAPYTNMAYIGSPANNINPTVCTPTAGPPSGYANCGNSVLYVSTANSMTVPVYNPACFESGSSLCHFEDACYPIGGPYYGADQYFVMSKSQPGLLKRYLKEEEKKVLCDLGYACSSTYSSTAAGATHTYISGACSGTTIWGNNDGISSGVFTYTMAAGGTLVIPKNNLKGNDSPSTSTITNASLIYTNQNITLTDNPSNVTLNMPLGSTFCGATMFKYIPKDAGGNAGNVTYVFIYVKCAGCSPPNICNMVQNGGFESGPVGCPNPFNPVTLNSTLTASCWYSFMRSPDLYSNFGCFVPANTLGSPTVASWFGVTGTHNGGTNRRAVGISNQVNPPFFPGNEESIRNDLSTPLVPNTNYVLSFWAFNTKGNNFLTLPNPQNVVLTFASSQPAYIIQPPGTSYPQTLNAFLSYTLPAADADNNWHRYTVTFTYTNTTNTFDDYLYIGIDGPKTGIANNYPSSTSTIFHAYVMFDDISLVPQSAALSFNLPAYACTGDVITNLNQFASNGGVGTTYLGSGVANTGSGNWNINTALLPTGLNSYTVLQTAANGCVYSDVASLNVIQVTTTLTAPVNGFCLMPPTTSVTLLNANGGPGTLTYSWQPSGSTASQIAVSPTTTTIYTLTASNGSCAVSKTATVYVIPQITFTNVPTTLCTGVRVNYLQNLLATGSPTGGSWVAPGLTLVQVATNSTALSGAPPATLGTHTVYYVYTAPSGCTVSAQFTINVVLTPTISVVGTSSMICSNLSWNSVTFNVNSVSGGPYFNTWAGGTYTSFLPGYNTTVVAQPSITTTYTVTSLNNGCYSNPVSITVSVTNQCCTAQNYITSSVLNGGSYSGQYAINQNITITNTVTIQGEFLMAPNVSITINPGGALITVVKPGVHIQSCNAMWSGITVLSGGKLRFEGYDIIEDAETAVTVINPQGVATSTLNSPVNFGITTFNRNKVAVSIKNYQQYITDALPVAFTFCTFTSRDLSIPPGTPWVQAAQAGLNFSNTPSSTLASPYVSSYPVANLKAPNSSIMAQYGIVMENCGITVSPLSLNPTYYSLVIGAVWTGTIGQTPNYSNMFDNLAYGIYSINSNVKSYQNVFQNTHTDVSNLPGAGILSVNNAITGNDYNASLDMVYVPNPTGRANKFYDCQQGIRTVNLPYLNASYCEFRSTQSKYVTPNATNAGNIGISITNNLFKNYTITNNKFYNLNTGIYATVANGSLPGIVSNFPVFGQMAYGQAWGIFTVKDNLFSPSVGNVANSYLGNAVVIENPMTTRAVTLNNTNVFLLPPNGGLNIVRNTLDRVWRGVYVNSFNSTLFKKAVSANTISIIADVNAANQQWGVRCNAVYSGEVKLNTINNYSGNANSPVTSSGVYLSMSSAATLQCNTTTSLGKGFQIAGANPGTFWRNNNMQSSLNGLALTNTGIMGLQGNNSNPVDNHWLGSWTGTNRGTYTDATSIASNSKLWVRNQSGYVPPNNSGLVYPQSYGGIGNIQVGNSAAVEFNCATAIYSDIPDKSDEGNPPTFRRLTDEAIVTDSLGYGKGLTSDVNKLNLFWMMDGDTTIRDSSIILQDYYNYELTTNKGSLLSAENALASGLDYDAQSILNTIGSWSTVEYNYIRFYALYLQYKQNGSLSEGEMEELYTLANLCPFDNGAIIYQARGFYNQLIGDFIVYSETACPEEILEEEMQGGGGNERRARTIPEPVNEGINQEGGVTIYPNPAKNELFLISKNESEGYEVSIRDVQGKLLGTINTVTANYKVRLQLNLINGIYFVSLKDKNGSFTNKKLVIAQ